MVRPNQHSSQQDRFYGVIWLLVVAALWSALLSSIFGLVAMGALIGMLLTRAAWARIVTLVVAAYAGLVGLLVSLFARGGASFAGLVATLMATGIFWLLLRPGMSDYFSSNPASAGGRVVPVAPRPGALPHLQQQRTPPPPRPAPTLGTGSTQEQWERLQQQLRAERIRQERETASSLGSEMPAKRSSFPWLTMTFAGLVFVYASAAGGELGKASLLLVIPGFIAAMVRWIAPRGFLLGVLALSGFLIVRPDWTIVSPEIGVLLQHHGPMVFAAVALLVYLVGMCVTGFAGDYEDHA